MEQELEERHALILIEQLTDKDALDVVDCEPLQLLPDSNSLDQELRDETLEEQLQISRLDFVEDRHEVLLDSLFNRG